MCEESESGLLEEYLGDHRVFLVDDGEHHWYVARSAGHALREHEELMEAEGPIFTVKELLPETRIEVHLEGPGDAKGYPAAFERIEPAADDEGGRYAVVAPAGAWAEHLGAGMTGVENGTQIASSCF